MIDRLCVPCETVNVAELVAVPPGVVTLILPVTAPVGTVAVICVEELTVKLADTPPNFAEVAPVKFVPMIVTTVPALPLAGENEVMVGAPVVTVKFFELVALPAGVVTVIFPVVAPDGTVAVILPEVLTVKEAETPLNFTEVAPVKFDPLIVTEVPTGPLVGEKLEIVGTAPVTTVKLFALVAVPLGVVTVILPVVAPEGTLVVIRVPPEFTLKLAETPLNLTEVVPVKFVPLTVTFVPTDPLVGEKLEMVGTAPVTVKSFALVAVPLGVVTVIRPVVAPDGTFVVILVPWELTLKSAEMPLKATFVVPVNPVPLIVTEVPTGPLVGENEVIVGADAAVVTVKFDALVAVPSGVVTMIFPLMAPVGTVAVTLVDETLLKAADVFLNFTPVTSMKLVPLIVTEVPTGPEDGENEVIVGASTAQAEGTASSPRRTPVRVRHATARRGSRPVSMRCLPTRAGTGPIVALGR